MIQLEFVRQFYPTEVRSNALFQKYILKEYLLLQILDFLSTTHYIRKISFIGGTNLRLVKGIDRFSENLDFDCKQLSKDEFMEMTDAVLHFLLRNGMRVEVKDKTNENLKAFRRNIHFPELLFDMKLTGHSDERFLIKVEAQDQIIDYKPIMTTIKGCGFFFSFPVPSDGVLCAMKITAMLSRKKGRDFYDAMFLLSQTTPDYHFLNARVGVRNIDELKEAVNETLKTVDLNQKMKDFEHLLFNKPNAARILHVGKFIAEL